ncbi:MAG: hypothetical protein D3916_05810 [Candidatus Electrothrix sp. MAN1_4]|nr:hypothetical protein [Candidatus Electrothrix sp. MAN1_4]
MSGKIRFYLDEHVPKSVAHGLRTCGVDVLTVGEMGLRGATDEEHLERAKSEQRVIFTQDDDFLRLHASGNEHTGIVYARQGTSVGALDAGMSFPWNQISF